MNEKQLDWRLKYSACLCTPEKVSNMTCRHMGRSIVSSCLCQQRRFPVTAPCGGSPTLLVEKRQKMSLTPAALARSRHTSTTLSVCTFLYWCDSVRGGSESIDKTASPADAPAAFRRIYWCSPSWTSGARQRVGLNATCIMSAPIYMEP